MNALRCCFPCCWPRSVQPTVSEDTPLNRQSTSEQLDTTEDLTVDPSVESNQQFDTLSTSLRDSSSQGGNTIKLCIKGDGNEFAVNIDLSCTTVEELKQQYAKAATIDLTTHRIVLKCGTTAMEDGVLISKYLSKINGEITAVIKPKNTEPATGDLPVTTGSTSNESRVGRKSLLVSANRAPNNIQITLKGKEGTGTFIINVNGATVLDIKAAYIDAIQGSLKTHQIVLKCGSRTLDDDTKFIKDYDIKDKGLIRVKCTK